MSAHLAQVKNRSGQRVARIRIYTGTLTQGWPVPPRAKKKSVTHVKFDRKTQRPKKIPSSSSLNSICMCNTHPWHENMEIILKLFPIQIFPTFAATVIRKTASAIEFHYSLPAWRVTSHIISRPCEVFVHLWGSHAVQLTDELFHDRK